MRRASVCGALSALLAVFLTACGGPVPAVGTTAPSGSAMLPEAQTDDLLYVHDLTGVFVYSYPGGKLVGQLAYSFGQQAGLCVDDAADVFIPDPTSAQIFEFAHGGRRPKATLMDTGYVPQGCAIDPKSGDLAVTGNGIGRGSGGLAIYHRARGNPQVYTDKRFSFYEFCAFDDSGNLYFDGDDSLRIVLHLHGSQREAQPSRAFD